MQTQRNICADGESPLLLQLHSGVFVTEQINDDDDDLKS